MSAKIMSGICLAMLLAGCGGSDGNIKFTPIPNPRRIFLRPIRSRGKMFIVI